MRKAPRRYRIHPKTNYLKLSCPLMKSTNLSISAGCERHSYIFFYSLTLN